MAPFNCFRLCFGYLLIMRAAFEWRIIDFYNKDIESRVYSSIVNAKGALYLFGGRQKQD
jgi:hypothetical protein